MSDPFTLAGVTLESRLFLGTAGYPNRQVMLDALAARVPAPVIALGGVCAGTPRRA